MFFVTEQNSSQNSNMEYLNEPTCTAHFDKRKNNTDQLTLATTSTTFYTTQESMTEHSDSINTDSGKLSQADESAN